MERLPEGNAQRGRTHRKKKLNTQAWIGADRTSKRKKKGVQ